MEVEYLEGSCAYEAELEVVDVGEPCAVFAANHTPRASETPERRGSKKNDDILKKNCIPGDAILKSGTSSSLLKAAVSNQSVKASEIHREAADTSCTTETISELDGDKRLFCETTRKSRELSRGSCVEKVEFDVVDEGVPDENDIYNRFFFESDHLALKDNPDYQLLLQTLAALEAQREQAIKDYETLIKMRKEALSEPIKFVEKLQNNESLGIPARQSIIKVPRINWEEYSGTMDDISQFGFFHQHNTRHSAAPSLEKVNQKWEEQSATSNGSITEESQETFSSRYVRGKLFTSEKSATFNQPWTTEEQKKLERLLQVFPQEPVEARRWSKIATALGNRTPKQVASRVQKYFIKLAKAGLPIPGRLPNLNRVLPKAPRARNTHQQQTVVSFRHSTFFPSYQPRVYMDDNERSDANSLVTSDDLADVSDDEAIPEELRNTKEYWELLQIKRLKRKRNAQHMMNKDSTIHDGFMGSCPFCTWVIETLGFASCLYTSCDLCGTSPITGTRWHCVDCPSDRSTDLCSDCVNTNPENAVHKGSHKMEPVDGSKSGDLVDGDYLKLGESSKGYNYLDPNFLPAAT